MKVLYTRSLFILLFCTIISQTINAQIFTPFSTWNHAGINGIYLQPASIADTRMKFDMSIIGFDINVGNSLYKLKKGFLTSGDFDEIFDEYKIPITNVSNHRVLAGIDVHVLNFMVPLSPKSALGITSRVRTMINVDGIDPNMFELMDQDLSDFIGDSYTIKDLAFRANAWAEVGVTYAREIFDLDKHYLKAGLTVKALQPVTSGYLYIENAGYQVGDPSKPIDQQNADDIWVSAKGEMAFPASFTEFDDFTDPSKMFDDWKVGKNLGFGFDFGLVYEYRPRHANYTNTNGGKSKWNRYEPSKYLFRVGLSILDVGSMKYDSNFPQQINMTASGMDVVNGGVLIPEGDIKDFSTLREAFGLDNPQETHYRVALPTAISLQTDWRINKIFYLGVNPYFALRQKKGNKVGTHYVTSVNVMPRLELAGVGLSLPVTYDQFKAFNIGLGLNLGPLWIGSNNAFNTLLTDVREINVCMAIRLSIYHKNNNKSGSKSLPTVTDTIL